MNSSNNSYNFSALVHKDVINKNDFKNEDDYNKIELNGLTQRFVRMLKNDFKRLGLKETNMSRKDMIVMVETYRTMISRMKNNEYFLTPFINDISSTIMEFYSDGEENE